MSSLRRSNPIRICGGPKSNKTLPARNDRDDETDDKDSKDQVKHPLRYFCPESYLSLSGHDIDTRGEVVDAIGG
jgi:hypothetical protein